MSESTPQSGHELEEIKYHTAKCDRCNKHNRATVYRCKTCATQICTPCRKIGRQIHVTKKAYTGVVFKPGRYTAGTPAKRRVLDEAAKASPERAQRPTMKNANNNDDAMGADALCLLGQQAPRQSNPDPDFSGLYCLAKVAHALWEQEHGAGFEPRGSKRSMVSSYSQLAVEIPSLKATKNDPLGENEEVIRSKRRRIAMIPMKGGCHQGQGRQLAENGRTLRENKEQVNCVQPDIAADRRI
jgi:hypothetical protein